MAAIVDWEDSAQYGSNEWHGESEKDLSPIMMATVGWIIREDPEWIIVAMDFTPARDETPYRNVCVIPRCNIRSIRRIEHTLFDRDRIHVVFEPKATES